MTGRASVREALRAATRQPHQRLHRHPGLSAAARGAIGLDDYRQLLMRLYGFHLAFEDAHASAMQKLGLITNSRAELIALDLAALGIMRFDVCRLPRCAALREPSSEACALGALYVVEGSALGGALIAEALAPIVGDARRFFLGGPSGREVWASLLARVETLAPGEQQARAIDAAVETFRIFEEWMFDWRAAPPCLDRLAVSSGSEN
ncbi:biliverdin-producing heme oxygenase [Methylocystis rosea]|uniref:Biliverdin-producing heme oxygenase n=1 Tax=Methylocystis rosea TaxID=173366 RepID=A0ABX6EHF6_9HYPH|nr:biliverdin-producing heme oxygenase [Methylocystis rosea]QGM93865.1 biliverdin-producing heme oxygenase [Methylocystis rosea]